MAASTCIVLQSAQMEVSVKYVETRFVQVKEYTQKETRMWANAQRDGCPAEHRWRPLFNAAKFR